MPRSIAEEGTFVDRVWWDFPVMFTRSKQRTYREQVIRVTRILIRFLDQHELVVRNAPLNQPAATDRIAEYLEQNEKEILSLKLPRTEPDFPPDLTIKESDLTNEGKAVMAGSLYRWLAAHDRGTSPEKTTILERELKKIRAR